MTTPFPTRLDRPRMVYVFGEPGTGAADLPLAFAAEEPISLRLRWSGAPTFRHRSDTTLVLGAYGLGNTLDLAVEGAPNAVYATMLADSFLQAPIALPGIAGVVRLAALNLFQSGFLDAFGHVGAQILIPNDPALVGAHIVWQGITLDLASGAPVLRGKVQLPVNAWWGSHGVWGGFWWYDWWWGDDVVQVHGDALAFRRWAPAYSATGAYLDARSELHVVDLANPDAPTLSSTVIQTDPNAWWGNLRVVGDTLYTSHYEWVDRPDHGGGWVRYYLDAIDLRDRAHPRIGAKINVPGLLVGGDASDPSIVYTVDYRWEAGAEQVNDFNVLRVRGNEATLIAHTPITGWVGSTFVRDHQAYLSAQRWIERPNGTRTARVELHAIDLRNPARPRDRVASDSGWGWLLAVEGDRALVTSGWWGEQAIDVYRLAEDRAPQFEQTIRTRGWWVNGVSRQDQTLFLSSGYWGVQKVSLQ